MHGPLARLLSQKVTSLKSAHSLVLSKGAHKITCSRVYLQAVKCKNVVRITMVTEEFRPNLSQSCRLRELKLSEPKFPWSYERKGRNSSDLSCNSKYPSPHDFYFIFLE